MTRRLAQSTAYTVVFKVFLSSDHVTPATGKTVAVTLSKAGAGFGNPNAGASNASEMTGGWYKFALDTTDTNTLGDLVLVGTATACDTADIIMMVVSATTGGASNLDAAISTVSTLTQANIRTAVGLAGANLDTQLSTIDDFLDTEIAAIKTQTDKLTFTVANQIDANIQYVNDVLVTGTGAAGNEWGP